MYNRHQLLDHNPESKHGSQEKLEAEPMPIPLVTKPQKRGLAWADPDDLNVQASLASGKRLRKLHDAVAEDKIGSRDNERCLRRQFENLNPTPTGLRMRRSGLNEGDLSPFLQYQRRSEALSPKTTNRVVERRELVSRS